MSLFDTHKINILAIRRYTYIESNGISPMTTVLYRLARELEIAQTSCVAKPILGECLSIFNKDNRCEAFQLSPSIRDLFDINVEVEAFLFRLLDYYSALHVVILN